MRDPPLPGAGLRALSYAVPHPRVAAGALVVLVVLVAAVAIVTRAGQRRKPKKMSAFRA